MKLAIIDANIKTQPRLVGSLTSYVAIWLQKEAEWAGVELHDAADADVILLVHAGYKQFSDHARAALKRNGIEPLSRNRNGPYVITGGGVACTPLLALAYADTVVVGQAWAFARLLMEKIARGESAMALKQWLVEYPHAIERSQISDVRQDEARPWLLSAEPERLASPDARVDWRRTSAGIRCDDKVVRYLGSFGCRGKCLFCATTWQQQFSENTDPAWSLAAMLSTHRGGGRVSLVTNDLMDLDFQSSIKVPLDSESMSIRAIVKTGVHALRERRCRRARFGVEGLSAKLRGAVGKPIAGDWLADSIVEMANNYHIQTHLFYIVGLPFEVEADWREFEDFYYRIARRLQWGLLRVKFTAYESCPPAPLTRFGPAPRYYERFQSLMKHIYSNCMSRHITQIKAAKPDTLAASMNENFQIDCGKNIISAGNFDLTPTIDDARRMQCELIEWPADAVRRWKMADLYRRHMTENA